LSGGALTVAALPGELVNIIDSAKANDIGVDHIIEKRLGILRRFTLIAINAVRGEVLIAKGVSRILTIIMYQPRHHLNENGLTCAGFTIAHKGEDKSAEIDKRV